VKPTLHIPGINNNKYPFNQVNEVDDAMDEETTTNFKIKSFIKPTNYVIKVSQPLSN
jgi:hypothetical protein